MHVQSGKLARLSRFVIAIAAAAFFLSGCSSDDNGSGSAAAPPGPTSPAGPGASPIATTGTINAADLTFNDLKDKALDGKILSVDTSGNQPVVKFQVVMKDSKVGVRGLTQFSLHLAQLQPEKEGSASYWLNYISDGLPLSAIPAFTERGATTQTAPVNPSADAVTVYNSDGSVKAKGYSVVDGGDGTYTVTFGANVKANTKVPYDAALIHRVVVGVRTVAAPGVVGKTPGDLRRPGNPLTGAVLAAFTNTNGANFAYDFTPPTGTMLVDSEGNQTFARDNVTSAACNQCHYKIEYGFPRGNNTSGHFGSRPGYQDLRRVPHAAKATGTTKASDAG